MQGTGVYLRAYQPAPYATSHLPCPSQRTCSGWQSGRARSRRRNGSSMLSPSAAVATAKACTASPTARCAACPASAASCTTAPGTGTGASSGAAGVAWPRRGSRARAAGAAAAGVATGWTAGGRAAGSGTAGGRLWRSRIAARLARAVWLLGCFGGSSRHVSLARLCQCTSPSAYSMRCWVPCWPACSGVKGVEWWAGR